MQTIEQWQAGARKLLENAVETFTDCTEPGKPIYHDYARLASRHPTFTGYWNATPIPTWTEPQRLRYWGILKAAARRRLARFLNGGKDPKRAVRPYQYRATVKFIAALEAAGPRGLSYEEISEQVYGGKSKRTVRQIYHGVHGVVEHARIRHKRVIRCERTDKDWRKTRYYLVEPQRDSVPSTINEAEVERNVSNG